MAQIDSSTGLPILVSGNTYILLGDFDSPAYDISGLDAGWTWFLTGWGYTTFIFDQIIDPLEHSVHVEMPETS